MRRYNKKKQKQQEELRQQKYKEYLISKKNKIEQSRVSQFQVLTENFPDPAKIESIILTRKRNLWERRVEDDDFLNVRVGIGTIPLKHINGKKSKELPSLMMKRMF